MKPRYALVGTVALLAAAATVTPAHAAKTVEKTMSGSFDFSDPTPDPTGNANSSNETHCDGKLPKEAPKGLKFPAPGKLKLTMSDFQGDWTLQIQDPQGKVVGGDDVNPPDFESATVKTKKAGTYKVLPCNLAGTPTAKVTWKFTYLVTVKK